jgi:Predicted nucleotide-binding protein containing TIR-like domain
MRIMSARVFLSSSTEGLELAKSIQDELDRVATIIRWDQGVFRPGDFPLDRLVELVIDYDFAIFVISPDDIADVRGKRVLVARDNVLFEAGLFFSQLNRNRTFLIKPDMHPMPSEPSFHLPSDLQGLTLVEYSPPDNPADLRAAIGAACHQIETAIKRLGPRPVGVALRNIDLLSGDPIFLLRHVELRTHKLSELACILRYFNDAEGDASIAWPKAAEYAVQTLSILGLIGFASGEAYIIDPGREFLANARVKRRFNDVFEKQLCPEDRKSPPASPDSGSSMQEEFERMSKHVLNYLNKLKENKMSMVSFETIRSRINAKYSDDLLLQMIDRYPEKFRRTTLEGNRKGVGIVE